MLRVLWLPPTDSQGRLGGRHGPRPTQQAGHWAPGVSQCAERWTVTGTELGSPEHQVPGPEAGPFTATVSFRPHNNATLRAQRRDLHFRAKMRKSGRPDASVLSLCPVHPSPTLLYAQLSEGDGDTLTASPPTDLRLHPLGSSGPKLA